MELIKIILLSVALVSIALLGLATRMLFKRGGKFPNTHVGRNRHLREQGIRCAQEQDKAERAKIEKQVDFKNVKILNTNK